MEIIQGGQIAGYAGWTGGLERRDCFGRLSGYLEGGPDARACVLYGLRRTGKSVMMFQAMLDNPDDSAYILCSPSDSPRSLAEEMDALRSAGVRKFFIDEVTLVPGFIEECQFLADLGAAGARVVLAGTDSLSFEFIRHRAFSGRTVTIHTTSIPFREHRRLTGTRTLDGYAMSGGILSDPEDFGEYPLEAIALNIQNSLRGNPDRNFLAIGKLCESGRLTTLIHQIVRDENHRFALDAVKKAWTSPEFFRTRNDIQSMPDFVRRIDPERLMARTRKRLGILKEGRHLATPQELYEINRFLQKLELVRPALVVAESDIALFGQLGEEGREEARMSLLDKLSYEKQAKNLEGRWLFTQPGLRWSQADALLAEMEKDARLMPEADAVGIGKAFSLIRASAMGSLMEEIIVNETAMARMDAIVFKYLPIDGDIDMVVSDSRGLHLMEIKHAGSARRGHGDHIRDGRNRRLLEETFGPIADAGVIYTGESGRKLGMDYLNAADYLEGLGRVERPAPRKWMRQ